MNWSFRAFTLFGIAVRIHWILPVFLLAEVVRVGWLASPGYGGAAFAYGAVFAVAYWLSILIHELGHCAAARSHGQSADEILLWPLGGLATVGGGGSPRSEVAIAVAGPLASFLIAGLCLGLAATGGYPLHVGLLDPFNGWRESIGYGYAVAMAVDLFKLNLIFGLFNLCVPAYPLDGGRVLRGLLGARIGFERATYFCTGLAVAVAILLGFWGLIQQQLTLVLIGGFVLLQAVQERRLLREGALPGYDATFLGHDFSRGYTSLEAGEREGAPGGGGSGFFAALRRRRAERRAQARQEEEDRLRERVDQLLDKVNRTGLPSLTPDERRFLEEASRRFQEFDAKR
jgi:stage IV sporulation protein FB